MTRRDVLAAIAAARRAVATYQREDLQKALGIAEQSEVQTINEQAKALGKEIKEARMMGPAGSACPTCGGSGRV